MAKKKILQTLLTTASGLAVMTGLAGDALGVGRQIQANNYDLSANINMSAAVANGDTIEFGAQADGTTTANVNILAIDTHGFDLSANEFTTIAGNFSIGSIVNRDKDGKTLKNAADTKAANALFNIKYGGDGTITLTGTGATAAQMFTNGAGEVDIPINNLSALGDLDLNGKVAVLRVNSTSGDPVNLENATFSSGDPGNVATELVVSTDTIINSNTVNQFKSWAIADSKSLEINVGKNNLVRANGAADYAFAGADAKLKITADADGGARTIDLQDSIAAAGADQGIIEFGSVTAATTVTVDDGNNAGINLGAAPVNRLNKFIVSGAGDITLTDKVTVFAKNTEVSGTGTYTITNAYDAGANSALKFNAAGKVVFLDNVTIAEADFNDVDGTIEIADGKTFTGTIDNKVGAGNKGTIKALGNLTVSDAIGATNAVKSVLSDGVDGKALTLDGDTRAQTFNLTNGANILVNGGNATIDDVVLGNANSQVQIANNRSLTFTGNEAAVNLGNNNLVFDGNDSVLALNAATQDVTYTIDNGALGGGAANRGIIELNAAATHTLTLAENNAGTIGGGANESLKALNIKGAGTSLITASVGDGNIDLIDVYDSTTAQFTAANIAEKTTAINIGKVAGAGTLAFDLSNGNVALNSGGVTFDHADSVLQFGLNNQAAARTVTLNADLASGDPAGKGKVIFNHVGTDSLTLNGDVAGRTLGTAAQNLKEVETRGTVIFDAGLGGVYAKNLKISDGSLTINGANFQVETITFNPQANDGVRINIGNNDIKGINFVNSNSAIQTNVISTTKDAISVNTPFGSANNSIGSIELAATGAQTLTISTSDFYGGIITNENGVDSLVINSALTNFARIGSAGRKFNTTNINENTTVIGDIYSNSVNVAAGKKLEVRGSTLDMSTLLLGGVAANVHAQALISGATDINFDIRTSTGETGKVDFRGAKNINKSIGASGNRLYTICFDAGDKSNVVRFANQGLFAKSVKFNNGTYQLANDMEVDGGLAVQGGSVLNLGTSKLTVKNGTSSFQGAVEIRTTLNADASTIGRIVADVGTGNELSFASLESLVVTVDDTSVAPSNNSQSYDFITLNSGTSTGADKLQEDGFEVVNLDTAFSKWSIDQAKGSNTIRLVRTNQTSVGLSKSFENVGAGSVPQEFLNFINDVDSQSVAAIFATQLSAMDDENRVNAVERVTNPGGQAAQQSINNVASGTAAGIANRVATFIANNPIPVSDNGMPIGVAAGDNPDKYGVWFSPFFEDARQKKRSSTAGYKSESVGATVGFDVKANEEIIVGAAATYVNTDVKYKDFKRGDKTRIESLLGSLYGMWQLDNYYLQGSATFGTSKVNNTELRRVSNTSLQAARGKNTSMSFSGELTGGYNFVVNNQFALTPHAGFGIVKINDSSYKESGVVGQSLDINKKSSAKVNLILGLRATASPYHFNGMEITPEAHAVVRHDLRGDQSKIEASLDRGIAGQSNVLSKKAPKTNKTFYNLGFGVNAEYNGYDYGFTYDANIASKYVAHQGSLKVRVNF